MDFKMSQAELEVEEEYVMKMKSVNSTYLPRIDRNRDTTKPTQQQRQKLIAQTETETESLKVENKTLVEMREEEAQNAKAVKQARKKNKLAAIRMKHAESTFKTDVDEDKTVDVDEDKTVAPSPTKPNGFWSIFGKKKKTSSIEEEPQIEEEEKLPIGEDSGKTPPAIDEDGNKTPEKAIDADGNKTPEKAIDKNGNKTPEKAIDEDGNKTKKAVRFEKDYIFSTPKKDQVDDDMEESDKENKTNADEMADDGTKLDIPEAPTHRAFPPVPNHTPRAQAQSQHITPLRRTPRKVAAQNYKV